MGAPMTDIAPDLQGLTQSEVDERIDQGRTNDVPDAPVRSTSQILRAAAELPHDTFIVATDQGIFYKLQQQAPDKEFIIAPTAGDGATCRSCANCPWMAMNELETLAGVFDRGDNEIFVDPDLGQRAMVPLRRAQLAARRQQWKCRKLNRVKQYPKQWCMQYFSYPFHLPSFHYCTITNSV